MKVAAKRKQLIQNCHGLTESAPKFSGDISNKEAAPSKPTTAGRKPLRTFFTGTVSTYLKNNLAINIISINEGSIKATVAVRLPNTDIISPYPALCTAT